NAESHREYALTIVSTGNVFAVLACPNPTGSSISGNHRSHCAISPGPYAVREAGSGGRYAGRSTATRSLNTVIPRVQPIRSTFNTPSSSRLDTSQALRQGVSFRAATRGQFSGGADTPHLQRGHSSSRSVPGEWTGHDRSWLQSWLRASVMARECLVGLTFRQ